MELLKNEQGQYVPYRGGSHARTTAALPAADHAEHAAGNTGPCPASHFAAEVTLYIREHYSPLTSCLLAYSTRIWLLVSTYKAHNAWPHSRSLNPAKYQNINTTVTDLHVIK